MNKEIEMVIIWNNHEGQMFGFVNIESYKRWLVDQMNYSYPIRGYDNDVYEIKDGEECTEDKIVEMFEWYHTIYI